MSIKNLIQNNEIVVDLSPCIEKNVAVSFIANKIIEAQPAKKEFEVPINYVAEICLTLDKNGLTYTVHNKNEYVKRIVLV